MENRIGAIPFIVKNDQTVVLFVTSMSRGRWIFPKGLAEEGETPAETCRREAFEEAGVKGSVLTDCPIEAAVSSEAGDERVETSVVFYPLAVEDIAEDWPERNKRLRHWAVIDDAANLADEADIRQVIFSFTRQLSKIKSAK